MRSITIILDNIRSLHNVGSILRTADGFGVTEVAAAGVTPFTSAANDTRLPHVALRARNQIHKTALGADESVTMKRFETPQEAISHYQKNGYQVWAIEQSDNAVSLRSAPKTPRKLSIVLGAEVEGISKDVLKLCDEVIELPMAGAKESFNVSVTAGIALYQLTFE